jgi:predicted PurR-regulated permease PerM
MNRKIFAALVAAAFLYIASPLIFPIAMGAVLAVLFTPWLERLEKKKVSRMLGASLLTFAITVVLILPGSLLIFFSVKTGFSQLQAWKKTEITGGGFFTDLMNMPRVHGFLVWITSVLPLEMNELSSTIQDLAGSIGARLTELLGGVLSQLPGFAVALTVVVLSTYFFLVDGPKLILFFRRNSIFSVLQTDQMIQTMKDMCRSVILAALVSGGVQAILELIACALTGTPNLALIGLLVFVGSFIPLVGSAPITLGVALQQFVEGRQTAGIVLLVMSVVILGVDNTVRPLFLRGTANLHPFLGFIAAIGGLQTLGFLGVFLGPILASLFVVTFQILTEHDERNEAAGQS